MDASKPLSGRTLLLAAAAYFVVCRGALAFAMPSGVSTLWPGSGLYLALLLVQAPRHWPRVFLAMMPASLAVNAGDRWDALLSPVFAASEGLEALVAAALLLPFGRGVELFGDTRRLAAFFVAVGCAHAVVAVLPAAVLSAALGEPFLVSWSTWGLTDGVGALVLTPALLLWSREGRRTLPRPRTREVVALGVGLAVVAGAGLALPASSGGLLAVFLGGLLVAARLGAHVSSVATLFTSAAAVALTSVERGAFAISGGSEREALLHVQAFVGLLSVGSLVTAELGRARTAAGGSRSLVGAVLVGQLVTVIAATGAALAVASRLLDRQLEDRYEALGRSLDLAAADVAYDLEACLSELRVVTQSDTFEVGDSEAIRRYLAEVVAESRSFGRIAYFDAGGAQVAAAGESAGALPPGLQAAVVRALGGRQSDAWLLAGSHETSEPATWAVATVTDETNESAIGALAGRVAPSHFEAHMQVPALATRGAVFVGVVDAAGRSLVAPLGERVEGAERFRRSFQVAEADGVRALALVVEFSTGFARGPIQRARVRMMLAGFLVLVLGTVVVGEWTRAQVAPLQELTAVARRLRDDDWTHPVPTGGPGEIAELAAALKAMIARRLDVETELLHARRNLESLNESLDRRVRAATAELEETNRELEAFTYSASHDLRAPLRHLASYSDLLLQGEDERLSAEGREHARTIARAAKKMGGLLDDLLELSRIGRRALNRRRVDSRAIVAEAWAGLAGAPGHGKAVLRVGDLPDVEGDPALLGLVWQNLLSNALKYSSGRGEPRVEVSAFEREGKRYFRVRDNGVGFDDRYRGKLFGVFQRLHRQEDYPGSGVGLAIAHRIVTRHGGTIEGRGEPDAGATFEFTVDEG